MESKSHVRVIRMRVLRVRSGAKVAVLMKEFLVRLSLQDDGGTVEFPVKERYKCGTIQPTGVDQAESVVNVA